MLTVVDAHNVWGYQSPDDFPIQAAMNPTFRKVIHFQNVCNAASILLSPLVAIARAIFAILLLIRLKLAEIWDEPQGDINLAAIKRYAQMQLVRAGLELTCLGPILGTVVDVTVTLERKKMLCCARA